MYSDIQNIASVSAPRTALQLKSALDNHKFEAVSFELWKWRRNVTLRKRYLLELVIQKRNDHQSLELELPGELYVLYATSQCCCERGERASLSRSNKYSYPPIPKGVITDSWGSNSWGSMNWYCLTRFSPLTCDDELCSKEDNCFHDFPIT